MIVPTAKEAEIFQFLLRAVEASKLDTILRAAGGWVRDKLMGKPCHDIDIAISDMTGQEFVTHIQSYATSIGRGDVLGGVGIIKANPDQSKHLETATLTMFDLSIDFVNLRSEVYAEESRIPIMKMGTPLEDALRRDLTINALFYNLHTAQVEDFTDKGLGDLSGRIIRTPLEPFQTLCDDPLRALRAVRFASRFGFQIEESLSLALRDPALHTSLIEKISRERVLAELNGMMTGPDPVLALDLLHAHSLLPTIFDAKNASADTPEGWEIRAMDVVHLISARTAQNGLREMDPELRKLLIISAVVSPLHIISLPLTATRQISLAEKMLKERLKAKLRDQESVTKINTAARQLIALPLSCSRLEAGLILRACGELWPLGLELATCILAADEGGDDPTEIFSHFEKLNGHIASMCLDGVWDLRPLFNGQEIKALFNVQGPEIGVVSTQLLHLQILHPDASKDRLLELHAESKS